MRIAIVEDDDKSAELLASYINRYEQERNCRFETVRFTDGLRFISNYKADIDIIFMDIMMPHMDGMAAARRLREVDENVCLIFVTNLANYAIKGYEVDALDFVVKPVRYFNFAMKLERAVKIRNRRARSEVVIPSIESSRRLALEDILYIEVKNHTLIYHTEDSKTFSVRGTMTSMEQQLCTQGFARCSNSYLVNLTKVTAVQKNMVVLGRGELPISRTQKTAFMRALAEFAGSV